MKSIKLQKLQAFTYSGRFRYEILHDPRSGHHERYTVLIPCSDEHVLVGRELPLDYVKEYIGELELLAPELWLGDSLAVKRVIQKRKRQKRMHDDGISEFGSIRGQRYPR